MIQYTIMNSIPYPDAEIHEHIDIPQVKDNGKGIMIFVDLILKKSK